MENSSNPLETNQCGYQSIYSFFIYVIKFNVSAVIYIFKNFCHQHKSDIRCVLFYQQLWIVKLVLRGYVGLLLP